MSCYFLIDTYIDEKNGRGLYDDYIRKVKQIVESFGGEYLLRTESITSLNPSRNPQRVIVIRFRPASGWIPVSRRKSIRPSCTSGRRVLTRER